jgi:hypothetical protein
VCERSERERSFRGPLAARLSAETVDSPRAASETPGAMDGFRGRTLVVATMHGKEAAIGPAIAAALGVEVRVAEGLDTDVLGTFTGEVERPAAPLETAYRKALLAIERTPGVTLAVASEGSFGPHPQFPFIPSGNELVVLVDTERDLEIHGSDLSTETNFARAECTSRAEVERFLDRARFPGHGVIVERPADASPDSPRFFKDLTTRSALLGTATDLLRSCDRIVLHTDMRAHRNPTRMLAIARAAEALAVRATSSCPVCGTPGFGPVDVRTGLPCELCGEPTALVLATIDGCVRCGHRIERSREDGRTSADAGQCQNCNP